MCGRSVSDCTYNAQSEVVDQGRASILTCQALISFRIVVTLYL